MSPIDPEFPVQGEKPWGPKLNAALGEMVDATNENSAAIADAGVGGNFAFEYHQAVPSASWMIFVPSRFNRAPNVQTRDDDGQVIFGDPIVTSEFVQIQFPTARTGYVVLT